MNNLILVSLFSTFFIVSCHYGIKILEWWRRNKYENDKAQFVSDLYRLQNKWGKKGQYQYSEALGLVIKSLNLPDEELPKSVHGQEILKALKDDAKAALIRELNES